MPSSIKLADGSTISATETAQQLLAQLRGGGDTEAATHRFLSLSTGVLVNLANVVSITPA